MSRRTPNRSRTKMLPVVCTGGGTHAEALLHMLRSGSDGTVAAVTSLARSTAADLARMTAGLNPRAPMVRSALPDPQQMVDGYRRWVFGPCPRCGRHPQVRDETLRKALGVSPRRLDISRDVGFR